MYKRQVLGSTFATSGICTAVTRLVTDELVTGTKKSVNADVYKRQEEENASFHERSRSVAEPNAPARPAEPLFSAPVPSPRPVPIAPPPACAPAPAPIPQPAIPAPAPVPLPESPPLSVQRPNIKKTLDKYAI